MVDTLLFTNPNAEYYKEPNPEREEGTIHGKGQDALHVKELIERQDGTSRAEIVQNQEEIVSN
eukprot:15281627-Ditylum_brightwellii.AAC.1